MKLRGVLVIALLGYIGRGTVAASANNGYKSSRLGKPRVNRSRNMAPQNDSDAFVAYHASRDPPRQQPGYGYGRYGQRSEYNRRDANSMDADRDYYMPSSSRSQRNEARKSGDMDTLSEFASVPQEDMQSAVAEMFPDLHSFDKHRSADVWKNMSEEHVGVLFEHLARLKQRNNQNGELLTADDMLEILKNRKSSSVCSLIGSTVFPVHLVTAEMIQYIDNDCHQMILGLHYSGDRRHEDRQRKHGTYASRAKRVQSPFKTFFEAHSGRSHLPVKALESFVTRFLDINKLRIKPSVDSTHNESNAPSCEMLGTFSRFITAKQAKEISWSCFEAAMQTEGQISDKFSQNSTRPRASSGPARHGRAGLGKDNGPEWHVFDQKFLLLLPEKLVTEGKKKFVEFLLRRVQYEVLSADMQTALLQSEEACGQLTADAVFGEWYGDRASLKPTSGRQSATERRAAAVITPQCFNALLGSTEVSIRESLAAYSANMFAAVSHNVDKSFFRYATGKQLELFGSEIRKEGSNDDSQCAYLQPEHVPKDLFGHVQSNCFRSWLASAESRRQSVKTVGEGLSRLPTSVLADIGGELLVQLSSADLRNFRQEHWTEFMKRDNCCAAIPDRAAALLFPSSSSSSPSSLPGSGKKIRFIPDAECMYRMLPLLQEAAVRSLSDVMPGDSISMLDANAVEAWQESIFDLLNRSKNAALVSGLGARVPADKPHPCRSLHQTAIVKYGFFAAHMSSSCAALIEGLESVDPKQLPAMPLPVIAQMPIDKVKAARDFRALTSNDVEVLSQSKRFCSSLDYAGFALVPISARAQFKSECIVAFLFLSVLTQGDMESLPGDAFAVFDSLAMSVLPTITWMTPSQMAAMGSKCPVGKTHPAAAIGKDTMAALLPAQIAALTSVHIASIPAASFELLTAVQAGSFSPPALKTITFDQVSAMTEEGFAGFTASHFAHFGDTSKTVSEKNPIKAIVKGKLSKLTNDARAAAEKLICSDNSGSAVAVNGILLLAICVLSVVLL